jgi:leucyl/phenylalanyl-tRNA--protein transferase
VSDRGRWRRLKPSEIVTAYSLGYFPMAERRDGPVGWLSPDPRCIIPLESFHTPRRLARTIQQGRFEIRLDSAFREVVQGCADRPETWISYEIEDVFCALHAQGLAHSFEVWSDGMLAGGVYGLSLGAVFFGESMFSRVRDASKVALISLLRHLRARGYQLFDVQYVNDHLVQFGPIEVPRARYLRLLSRALQTEATFLP